MSESHTNPEGKKVPISDEDLNKLLNILKTVDYGSVTLIIQGGKVVQMEKSEKLRLK